MTYPICPAGSDRTASSSTRRATSQAEASRSMKVGTEATVKRRRHRGNRRRRHHRRRRLGVNHAGGVVAAAAVVAVAVVGAVDGAEGDSSRRNLLGKGCPPGSGYHWENLNCANHSGNLGWVLEHQGLHCCPWEVCLGIEPRK